MKKQLVGEVYKIRFRDKTYPIEGMIVDYGEYFCLVRVIDSYRLDGYAIVDSRYIKSLSRDEKEEWTEKVIKRKYRRLKKAPQMQLNDLKTIFKAITKKFGAFIIRTHDNKVLWVGRFKSMTARTLIIEFLSTRSEWDGTKKFKLNDIRVIEFDNDYINTLKMMMMK